MRYMIKGGIWKNTEDEILKAAVMKYGLNQWSRISSLLVRKSAKECKARWYEWLDPSIKKIDWTREEEEKLLHLAKIFPNQWRTIAPVIGRTPAQCIEHYEKLLDKAQGKEKMDENDPRKLRPGEVDPNPETKPARPDEIDMDEDVKEMLQEARARLANTKGKKAKRKAREKILEEARRLAALQKKRELKAAGIEFQIPKKMKGMNYNKEIPFERLVPKGRFEFGVDEEPNPDPFKSNISLQQMEGGKRDIEMKMRRMQDVKKIKKLKEKNFPQAMDMINKINEGTISHNRKLILPEPQINDEELQSLAKFSTGIDEENINTTSNTLVGEYRDRGPTPVTMRTPTLEDNIMKQAQNAAILREADTPLIGGENRELQEEDKNGLSHEIRTPNLLLNRIQTNQNDNLSVSVKSQSTAIPGRSTPLRDAMQINDISNNAWEVSSTPATISEIDHRERLKDQLQSLPKPQNEYQAEMPELEEEKHNSDSEEEDMEDIISHQKAESKQHHQMEQKQRSLVMQHNLPRPFTIPEQLHSIPQQSTPTKSHTEAVTLINTELLKLISSDNAHNPITNTSYQNNNNHNLISNKESVHVLPLSLQDLSMTNNVIQQEITKMKEEGIGEEDYQVNSKMWSNVYHQSSFFPSSCDFEPISQATLAENVEAQAFSLNNAVCAFQKAKSKVQSLENKCDLFFKGYYHRFNNNKQKWQDLTQTYDANLIKKDVFSTMLLQERKALMRREGQLREILRSQTNKEGELQLKYLELRRKKEQLGKEVSELYLDE